jgi:DNA-binding CsgD family transcriptional regulator
MQILRSLFAEPRGEDVPMKRSTIILDERAQIIMCGGHTSDFVAAFDGITNALRSDLRAIAAAHIHDPGDDLKISFIEPHWVVRTQPIHNREQRFYAMSIELVPNVDALSRAAQRFSLTRRELDVLTLMLDGLFAPEIAETLNIATGTVQVYYKRLLRKTDSRNRMAMVAQVLAWEGGKARDDEYERRDRSWKGASKLDAAI